MWIVIRNSFSPTASPWRFLFHRHIGIGRSSGWFRMDGIRMKITFGVDPVPIICAAVRSSTVHMPRLYATTCGAHEPVPLVGKNPPPAIAPISTHPRDPRRQSERRAATFTPPPTRACPSSSSRCADGTPHDLTSRDDDTTTKLPARGPTARSGPRAGRDDVRVATAVRTRRPDRRVVSLPRDRPSRRVRPRRDPGRGARRAATHRSRVIDR